MNSMGCMNLLPTTKNAPSDSPSSPSASMVSSCRVGVDANSHADVHVVNTQVAAAPAVVVAPVADVEIGSMVGLDCSVCTRYTVGQMLLLLMLLML